MEFWNSELTEKSWKILQEIRTKYNFILIGGWATYLWAKQQKSKDVDIVVDILELHKLKKENLSKNENLKKYEIKFGDIDIDIYVEYYSKLTIPVEDIKHYATKLQGFNVVIPEILLILKQGAEKDREHSIKGEKDRQDIVSLLFFSEIDFKKYDEILSKYSKKEYLLRLKSILTSFKNYNSMNMSPGDLKKKKDSIINRIRLI